MKFTNSVRVAVAALLLTACFSVKSYAVDAILFPWSSEVIQDTNGNPVSGCKLEVFAAGTTNQLTVYSDKELATAAANPIVCNSAGVLPVRYIGTDAYKVTFKDSADATLSNYDSVDNALGALDTSSFLTGNVAPSRTIEAKTTAFTTVVGDTGKQFNLDPTGGSFTATLVSAVTLGANGDFVFKHSGTAGEATVATSGGQFLDVSGNTTHVLQPGDAITVRSDGANYYVVEAFEYTSGIVTISYASSITPAFLHSTNTDYQVTLTGDLTINAPTNVRVGTRGTFTLIQDGTGGHEVSWNSVFKGNVAVNQSANAVTVVGFHVRSTTEIDFWLETGRYFLVAVLEHQEAQNTNGGTATTGSWEDRTINTIVLNTIGVTLASNAFTLPPGSYWIEWIAPSIQTNQHQTRLFDVDGAAQVGAGMISGENAVDNALSTGGVGITITADNSYKLQSQVAATKATVGYGGAGNFTTEVYLRILIYAR